MLSYENAAVETKPNYRSIEEVGFGQKQASMDIAT